MGKLIYSGIASLDGYIADQEGKFDWAVPDDEVFAYITDLERDSKTYLYGRRTYQTMTAWETLDAEPGQTELMIDFARMWQAADKIVYSTTLAEPSTARTRVEATFDPDRVRALKESAEHDVMIGGPTLAAHAIRSGLVDEYDLFLVPVIVGGGLPLFPTGARASLQQIGLRRFGNQTVHLRYRQTG